MMPALMYHDVVPECAEDSSGFPGSDAALYKVSPDQLEQHLSAIGEALLSASAGRQRSTHRLDLTFDDGGQSALAAAELLERHGWRGHFFVTTNYIGTRGFLDDRAIRALHGRGHVVGSHSCSHPLRMGHCGWTQLLDEWRRSRDVISNIVGEAITAASVPGGDYAPAVAAAAAQAGFSILFTSEPTCEPRRVFGLDLRGRFTVQRRTPVSTVAGLASGEWLPRLRQTLGWNVKKLGKRVGGERYLAVRKLLLRHGDEVRWGDGKSEVRSQKSEVRR